MQKINTIALALDFSVPSRNAYRYAKALAGAVSATLTLVHVREKAARLSNAMVPSFPAVNDSDLIRDIETLVAEEDSGSDPLDGLKIKILSGDPGSVLSELPENTGTDLIVMGTTGSSGIFTKLFGSVSLHVSNQAHCPVLLIPHQAIWHPIKQILYAGDYDTMSSALVNKIISFSLNFQAVIHFVNVSNNGTVLENKHNDRKAKARLTGDHSGMGVREMTIYGGDTLAELKRYSAANEVDMMAFVGRHRSFWSRVIEKSITENMAWSTTIPMLVMHLDDTY